MVVVSAPDVNNFCELSIHNPLTQPQGNPNFVSLLAIHKEFIANARKFYSNFRVEQHGCACVSVDEQQYALHSRIAFLPQRKLG